MAKKAASPDTVIAQWYTLIENDAGLAARLLPIGRGALTDNARGDRGGGSHARR